MQKDDAPMFKKTSDLNKSQSAGVEQLARPPFSMGTYICFTTRTNAHHPHNRGLEQTIAT